MDFDAINMDAPEGSRKFCQIVFTIKNEESPCTIALLASEMVEDIYTKLVIQGHTIKSVNVTFVFEAS